MSKLDCLRELSQVKRNDAVDLLRVCDAYVDQYAYAHNLDPDCDCMMCEKCKQEAIGELEELLG